MQRRPVLSFWQIWNMCFGFLGIQFGFALQNANVSRIFQTLGAEVGDLPILWVAAPLTGLIVQPIVGYLSDRTWNRYGRRRPYFTIGAILATLALFVMPNSPTPPIGITSTPGEPGALSTFCNVTTSPTKPSGHASPANHVRTGPVRVAGATRIVRVVRPLWVAGKTQNRQENWAKL